MTTCSSFKTIKSNYSSLLMEELVAMLKKENIQGAVELMEGYRLTPLILNEHLSSLTALSSKTSPLAAIPPAIKAKLTRLFNKRHEDAKLMKKTGKAATQEHAKFNTVLEELEAEDEEEGQGNDSAEEEVDKKVAKVKKGKKK